MGTKFSFFNFPVCKTYIGTWAHRARRARTARRAHGHAGTLGEPFSRLQKGAFSRLHEERVAFQANLLYPFLFFFSFKILASEDSNGCLANRSNVLLHSNKNTFY